MARQEFKTAVIVARFKHCGGRCEWVDTDGKRCDALLKPGAYHADHDNPDGLTGKPTFENCRILCIPHHKEKTKKDVADIAEAKRREARFLGAKKPAGNLRSPGFAKADKPPRKPIDKLAALGPSNLARRFV